MHTGCQLARGFVCGAGYALFGQTRPRCGIQAQPRVDLALVPIARQPRCQRRKRQQNAQHLHQTLPAWAVKAQLFQRIQLPCLAVIEHPLVPCIIAGIPNSAQVFQQVSTHNLAHHPTHSLP